MRQSHDLFHIPTIKWWPAIRLGPFGLFGTKGRPGDFIVFKDKHGNPIHSNRYEKNSEKIMHISDSDGLEWHTLPALSQLQDFPLDLSKIVKKPRYKGDATMLAYLTAKRENPTGNFDKWTAHSQSTQARTYVVPGKPQALPRGLSKTGSYQGDPTMLAYLKAKQENPTASFDELMADAQKAVKANSNI